MALDAARGVAAIIVMLYHIHKYVYPQIYVSATPQLLQHSYLAVDLFFLMSGFVIARAYESKLLLSHMRFVGFCATRLVRLWPLYFAGTLLGFAYFCLKATLIHDAGFDFEHGLIVLCENLLFIPDMSNLTDGLFPFNPAAWSLSLEVAINLLYAAFAIHFSTTFLTGIAVVSALCLSVAAFDYGSMDMGWGVSTLVGGSLRILFSFSVGVIIYRFQRAMQPHVPQIGVALLLTGLGVCLLSPIPLPGVFYDLFCVFLAFPWFVILGCYAMVPPQMERACDMLGRMSYAIYILHTPLILWFCGSWKLLATSDPTLIPSVTAPLLLCAVMLASFLASVWFDEPVRRWVRPKLYSILRTRVR